MSLRSQGHSQSVSAAKVGISERTGRKLEKTEKAPQGTRPWRTRRDPFEAVWKSVCQPLLKKAPTLLPITLLEHLQDRYPGQYPDKLLRTLERRVKLWRALHGEAQEVIFCQNHPPGLRGLSDFTQLKRVAITIQGEALNHLLYHFRLACSGWSHLKVVLGGESFTALAEGLQGALWRLGGVPHEHRTDSLSAAFRNLSADETVDITERYKQLCAHYGMKATRNQRGKGHENGSIESPHGHVKRRIEQALMLRDSCDFESIESYQHWLDDVVHRHNQRNAPTLAMEREHLLPLPRHKTTDFTEVCARVTSSATIDIRRVTYTVPSRLKGERIRVHLYHDRLEIYLGAIHVMRLSRGYAPPGQRARQVDYRHVIDSLVRKPQAFRYSQLRDDLLPNNHWQTIWQHIDQHWEPQAACRLIVGLLHLAATADCERALEHHVLQQIATHQRLSLSELSCHYRPPCAQTVDQAIATHSPTTGIIQHVLADYDELTTSSLPVDGTSSYREVNHGE